MLKPYQRRAFLLLALAALESGAASAVRADDTVSLWDVLAHTESTPAPGAASGPYGITVASAIAPRLPLGPVPGFTLPAPRRAASDVSGLFTKKKPKRGLFGSLGEWFDQLQKATGSSIKASGHQTLSMHMDSVSGNASAYQDDHYYGRGSNGIYNDTNLTVDATVFKYFHYQTSISNNLFTNPNDNRVKLDYNTKNLRFELGDINSGFQGNSLIDFNRYLSGVQLTAQWPRDVRTSLLYSQTKAETRTLTIPGNGSSGPYYVYAGQIVQGSEHVRVDNRDLVEGVDRDFTLDPYTGELRFNHGIVVLPSSTIAVSYETLGYNQQRGSIYGIRTEFAPKGPARFGVMYAMQQATGSSSPQTRTQEFGGYVTPGSSYYLDAPADLSKPIIVTVDGVPLARDVDYIIDPSRLNQVIIRRSIPTTSRVIIQYVPLNSDPTPGNRSVLGVDTHLSLGKIGGLTLEGALSGLSLSDKDYNGHAWQIRADLNPLRSLHTTVALRNIDPNFSSIQSPGFNRNEKALEFTSDYNPTRDLHFNLNWTLSQRPSYSGTDGSGQYVPNYSGMDDYKQ
jgi:hypothetical protein